jgi:hypothetical protein
MGRVHILERFERFHSDFVKLCHFIDESLHRGAFFSSHFFISLHCVGQFPAPVV